MNKNKLIQDSRLNLVISSELKKNIEREAEKRGLSTAAYVRMILSDATRGSKPDRKGMSHASLFEDAVSDTTIVVDPKNETISERLDKAK